MLRDISFNFERALDFMRNLGLSFCMAREDIHQRIFNEGVIFESALVFGKGWDCWILCQYVICQFKKNV